MALTLAFLALGLLATAAQALAASLPDTQKPLISTGTIVRPAVEADLDDIVTIIIDAFSPSPAWQYIYTQLDEYHDFFWHCLRKELATEFAHHGNTSFINVIDKPGTSADAARPSNHELAKVVAVAGWMILTPTDEEEALDHQPITGFDSHAVLTRCSDHPELNRTRALDWAPQVNAAEKRYIDDRREDQFYLEMLATHPDWDGHGFGAAHLAWGFDKAKSVSESLPITLLSTPAGWPLYDSVGFESVKNITITTLDDDLDDLWYEYMKFGQFSSEL